MNHRQLAYFLEIYNCKSIKKASKRLMITHQGLSKTIKSLESELGVTLFTYSNMQMLPTMYAKELFPHAVRIINEYHQIEEKAIFRKHVTVYAAEGACKNHLSALFTDFSAQHPQISLKIIEVSNAIAITHLRNDDTDFAFLQSAIESPEYENIFLFEDIFCLGINKNHPLAGKENLTSDDLDGQYVAMKSQDNIITEHKIANLHQKGIHPILLVESNAESLLLSFAERNLAICTISMQTALRYTGNNIIFRQQPPDVSDQINLVYKKKHYFGPEAELFRNFVIEWMHIYLTKTSHT